MEMESIEDVKKKLSSEIESIDFGDRVYLIVERKTKGSLQKINVGFSTMELVGLLDWSIRDIRDQAMKLVDPKEISRSAVSYEEKK